MTTTSARDLGISKDRDMQEDEGEEPAQGFMGKLLHSAKCAVKAISGKQPRGAKAEPVRKRGAQGKSVKAEVASSEQASRKRKAKELGTKPQRVRKKDGDEEASAAQKQAEVPQRMQGCLDIDFASWNPANIARQWRELAGNSSEPEDEGQEAAAYLKDADSHQTLEAISRAAFAARRTVAIPDAQLRALGLLEDEAPEAALRFWGGEELASVGDGRWYPKRFVKAEGDMAMDEWMQKEAEGVIPSGDYVVTAILDERKRPKGKSTEYIVKWQGFELNPNQWLPLKMLWATEAMRDWEHKRAQGGPRAPCQKHGDLIMNSSSLPGKRRPGRPRKSEEVLKKSPSLPGKRKPGRPRKTEEAPKKSTSLSGKRKPGRPRMTEEAPKKSTSLSGKRKPGRPRKTEEAPKKARNQSPLQKGKKQARKKNAASMGAKQKPK